MAPRTNLVGRHRELESGCASLGDRDRLLLVVGEAGIGKSRFSAEVVDRFVARGWTCIASGCLPLTETLPLLPIADAFRSLLRIERGRALRTALEQCPPYARREISRLLPQLEQGRALDGPVEGWQRERLFTAIGDVLDTLAGAPPSGMLLLVEDLHWADEGTLDVLTYLLGGDRHPRFRLMTTCRTDEPRLDPHVAGWLGQVRRSPDVGEIRLGPLSPDETAVVVAGLLGIPDDRLAAEVHQRAEGNPFYIEQLVGTALADAEDAERALPRRLPQGLADLLASRVGAVGESARSVLAALAVGGRPMAEPLLVQITGLDNESLRRALRELAVAGLLAPSSPDGLTRPRHALLAESVLDGLLPGERIAIHARTASALEALDDPALAAEVAVHWSRAGHRVEELRATLTAAEAAVGIFAFTEAAQLWQHAIALVDRSPYLSVEVEVDVATLHVRAIDALSALGRTAECRQLAERAYARFADVPDRSVAASIHIRVARMRGIDSAAAARPLFEQALMLFEGTPPSAQYAQALFHHANLHRQVGDTNAGTAGLEHALGVAEQADAPEVAARVLGPLSYGHHLRGDLEQASRALRRGRALVARLDEGGADFEAAVSSVACFDSDASLKLGRFQDAIQASTEGLERLRRAGRDRCFSATILVANAVEGLVAVGRLAEAGALIDPLTGSEQRQEDWILHSSRAEVDLWRGHLAEAEHRMQALVGLQSGESLILDWEHARIVAEIALWQHRPDHALAIAEAALGDVEGTDIQLFSGELLVQAARACADLAETAQAKRDSSGAVEALSALDRLDGMVSRMEGQPFDDHPFVARIGADRAAWAAEVSRARGRSQPDLWEAAATAFESLGRGHQVAYARWRQAEAILVRDPTGREAAPLLRAGLAVASAVGAEPLIAVITTLAQRARVRIDPHSSPVAPTPAPREPVRFGLTERELLVLQLLTTGLTNKQIGAELYMSPKTASVHVSNILRKLGVANRVEAAAVAERAGLSGS